MSNNCLVILFFQKSLKSDLNCCLYCYMTFEFFRVSALKKNIIFIIIFFNQNINIAFGNILHIIAYFIPFSSDRKYSGAVFEDNGTYLMGAAQFLFPEGREDILDVCQNYAEEGLRVLVLAHSTQMAEETELPENLEPAALLLLTDVIREEAPDTLQFFDSQEVDLNVISGDDPVTVSAIAKRAGLKNAENYLP